MAASDGQGVGAGSGEGTAQPGGDRALPRDGEAQRDAMATSESPATAAVPAEDEPGGAGSSMVGERDPRDTDDIGSTDRMASETGGLAGTSR